MTSFFDGVGGVFLFSEDPKALAEWYASNFGFTFSGAESVYQMMVYLDPEEPTRQCNFHFAIMKAKVPVPRRAVPNPEPAEAEEMYGDQPMMLNLRVRSLDDAAAHLATNGVTIIRRDDLDYGKFAWARDLDGNRVELYESIPGAFG
ncbi:MAG: hypothetical protein ACI81R_002205 [Bradymonadia bacterium]|jgi:hypothetical protein